MMCIHFHLSNQDKIGILNIVVLIITAFVLYKTLQAIKNSNEENARLNRLQAAENTIMKQIEFHYNLLNGITVTYLSVNRHGQDAFQAMYASLKESYKIIPGDFAPTYDGEEKRIKESFTQLYYSYGSQFGNYFKNLYLLISYVDDIKIKEFNKEYYIDLVKSQLSKYEILLLAYDCIWIQNKPKGKNFIEYASTHNLLTALETKELIESYSGFKHKDLFISKYRIKFDKPIEFND